MKGELNLPKILHLYWAGSPMSWLQVMTVTTFHDLNPDWVINIYIPIQQERGKRNLRRVSDYTGLDYLNNVLNLPYVNTQEVHLRDYGIVSKIHHILCSDILRYHVLYEQGGVWSDFDVLWLKSMTELHKMDYTGNLDNIGISICRFERPIDVSVPISIKKRVSNTHATIGILLAKPKHPWYAKLKEECQVLLETKSVNNFRDQSFGVPLWDSFFPMYSSMQKEYNDVVSFAYKTFYPYSVFELKLLYNETDNLDLITNEVMAVHWFNGHKKSKNYMTKPEPFCTMTQLVRLLRDKKYEDLHIR